MEGQPATRQIASGDRRRSFGRGGAGNIRSTTEATISTSPNGGSSLSLRRRSSVSTSSTGGSSARRPKIFGLTKIKNIFSIGPPEKEEAEDGEEEAT